MLIPMVLARDSSTVGAKADGGSRADRVARSGRSSVGSRVALISLAFAVLAFVAVFVPGYLTFDAELGRLSPAQFPYYFPLMMVHVLTATVTITTCVLQVWPWMLRRHPRVHRWVGRVYVVCVYPAALSVIVISVLWPFGAVSGLSDIVHALAWVVATTAGYLYIRRGQYFYHRRWMLRSFVLTVSNILNRVVGLPIQAVLATQLHSTFGGDENAMLQAIAAANSWLCWTVSLIALEWWMDRDFRRFGPGRRAVAAANEQLGRLKRLDDVMPAPAADRTTASAPATSQ